jgi:hypothetical protein
VILEAKRRRGVSKRESSLDVCAFLVDKTRGEERGDIVSGD